MKTIEIKIIVKVPEDCPMDDDYICREIESDLKYRFADATGFEIYEIETELINT